MEYNIETFHRLAEKYLKYQFMFYPLNCKNVDQKLQRAIIQLHQSNTNTMYSIRKIVELRMVNDVYSLSRSMFESIVNMGLIISNKVNNAADRFIEYQYVETYKIFQHLKRVEPEPGFVNKVYKADTIKAITKGRDNFILKYRNINNWCDLNMIERIKLIDNTFPPTCSNNKIYEYLYCQVYRKGSNAIHSTFAGLGRANVLRLIEFDNNNYILPMENIDHLIAASIHSLVVYLSSIRFIGYLISNKKNDIESYYQQENSRIFEGKE